MRAFLLLLSAFLTAVSGGAGVARAAEGAQVVATASEIASTNQVAVPQAGPMLFGSHHAAEPAAIASFALVRRPIVTDRLLI